jgi:hypothetical protein
MNFLRSRKGVIGITAAVSLALLLFGAAYIHSSTGPVPDTAIVAEVGGEPITAAELKRMLGQQRASVIDYFKRTYGEDLGENFWHTDYQGEVPADTARSWALKEAVKIKLQLKLAESHGMINGTSYDDLLAEMEQENARRDAALQAGLPVYGPVRFDEGSFMDFYISRILIELKVRLSEDELGVTDRQLMQHYESLKDELFRLEDSVRFYKISVSYLDDGVQVDSGMKQTVQGMMVNIKQQLEQGKTVHEMVEEMQEVDTAPPIQIAEEHFNEDTARMYFKSLPELYDVLTNIKENDQISRVIDDRSTGQLVLAMIIGREANGYRSFEEQKDIVRRHYTNVLYEAYLNKLIEEADVNIDDNYYRVPVN